MDYCGIQPKDEWIYLEEIGDAITIKMKEEPLIYHKEYIGARTLQKDLIAVQTYLQSEFLT